MANIKLFRNGEYVLLTIQKYLNEYHSELSPSWHEYMTWVNEGMNIGNDKEYASFTKKLNLKFWNLEKVLQFYEDAKKSELGLLFDDDILKFFAHLYGLGYFDRVGNPKLQDWIKIKGVFKPNRDNIPLDEKYSLLDLVYLKNGVNAIKNDLLFALKW